MIAATRSLGCLAARNQNCLLSKAGSTPGRESMRSSNGAMTPIPISAQKCLFDPVGEISSVHRRISSAWRVTPVFRKIVVSWNQLALARFSQGTKISFGACINSPSYLGRDVMKSRTTFIESGMRPASWSRLGSHGVMFLSARAGVSRSDGRA